MAELMCIRQAERDGIRLGLEFLKTEKWRREFRRQAVLADALLRQYGEDALVAALETAEGTQIYTLAAKKLLAHIIGEFARPKAPSGPRPPMSTSNLKSRLRELDA